MPNYVNFLMLAFLLIEHLSLNWHTPHPVTGIHFLEDQVIGKSGVGSTSNRRQ